MRRSHIDGAMTHGIDPGSDSEKGWRMKPEREGMGDSNPCRGASVPRVRPMRSDGTGQRIRESLHGWKLALRSDSSYFAHAYRGLIIALTAVLLGVDSAGWCLLLLSFGLVLVAEAAHTALAIAESSRPGTESAEDDETSHHWENARHVASGGVLIAVLIAAIVTAIVLGQHLETYINYGS